MSRFFVGQRVRMARPVHAKHMGRVGAIREFFDEVEVIGGAVNCWVNWDDGRPDGHVSDGFGGTSTHTEQLEPLTDPGREVVSWDTCDWKPEHLRENTHA